MYESVDIACKCIGVLAQYGDYLSKQHKKTSFVFNWGAHAIPKGREIVGKALKDKRMQQTGWRAGTYVPKSERWQGKVGVLTPGKAVMGLSPPEEEEKKEGYTGGTGPTQ